MNDMKRFEKFAIVLLILWTVTLVPNRMIFMIMGPLLKSSVAIDQMMVMQVALGTAQRLLGAALHIAIAAWLFTQATRDGTARWVWSLFAVLFGLSAAILYFLLRLLKEARLIREAQETRQQSPGEYSSKAADGLTGNAQE